MPPLLQPKHASHKLVFSDPEVLVGINFGHDFINCSGSNNKRDCKHRDEHGTKQVKTNNAW